MENQASNGKENVDYRAKNGAAWQFKPGNKAAVGHGQRKMDLPKEYAAALLEETPLDRWRNVVRRALEKAEKGDRFAREWLADRILGKAKESINFNHSGDVNLIQFQTLIIGALSRHPAARDEMIADLRSMAKEIDDGRLP